MGVMTVRPLVMVTCSLDTFVIQLKMSEMVISLVASCHQKAELSEWLHEALNDKHILVNSYSFSQG